MCFPVTLYIACVCVSPPLYIYHVCGYFMCVFHVCVSRVCRFGAVFACDSIYSMYVRISCVCFSCVSRVCVGLEQCFATTLGVSSVRV